MALSFSSSALCTHNLKQVEGLFLASVLGQFCTFAHSQIAEFRTHAIVIEYVAKTAFAPAKFLHRERRGWVLMEEGDNSVSRDIPNRRRELASDSSIDSLIRQYGYRPQEARKLGEEAGEFSVLAEAGFGQ